MHELELQTNRVQSNPFNSMAHPPAEASHSHSLLAAHHIDKYMEKFQKLAKSYQLPRDKWNFRLSQDLSGAAYEVYSRLPPGHENNFECLKVVLLKWYKLISHMYRQKVQVCQEGSK